LFVVCLCVRAASVLQLKKKLKHVKKKLRAHDEIRTSSEKSASTPSSASSSSASSLNPAHNNSDNKGEKGLLKSSQTAHNSDESPIAGSPIQGE
jgi:hypothetical protein